MNKTYGDLVSSIRGMFKLISSDNIVTNRMILAEIQTANILLSTQQLQKRNGWNSPNLFTVLNCIEMEPVPMYNCCGAGDTCTVAKSKKRLPRIVEVNNVLAVQGVWTVDKMVRFKEIGTFDRYSNLLKLYPEKGNTERLFWIEDNYLFTNDPLIEIMSIAAFLADVLDPNEYACSGPPECPMNPLDLEFKTLAKSENDIKKIVREIITRDYKQSVADVTENDLDESK
jgi:hypothetical protein